MNYSQIKDKVDQTVKDSAGKLTSIEREKWIQEAVRTYSTDRPRTVVKDVTGNGTKYYDVAANLASWADSFSTILSIEYPTDEEVPLYLEEDDDFILYRKESGLFIRFTNDLPSASEKIRVTYTSLHILSETQNTIPLVDQDAVCNLASSLCSQALASAYAETSDPTIGADSVNYRTKSQEYGSRAKEQKKLYLDHLGDEDVAPASVRKAMDVTYPGGGDRLTHPRKWR